MSLLTTCILRKDVVQEYLEKKYLLAFVVAECMHGDCVALFMHECSGLSLFPISRRIICAPRPETFNDTMSFLYTSHSRHVLA
jgi:hypothetical protein